MQKTSNDKKRSSNFTSKELLQELVQKYWSTLECKKTNGTNWKNKADYWETLSQEFNAINSNLEARSAVVLKKKWENCKKAIKDKVANEKVHKKGTGEGPFLNINYDHNEEQLLSLINIQATGTHSQCDGDADSDTEDTINVSPKEVEEPIWTTLSVQQLQQPPSALISRRNQRTGNNTTTRTDNTVKPNTKKSHGDDDEPKVVRVGRN